MYSNNFQKDIPKLSGTMTLTMQQQMLNRHLVYYNVFHRHLIYFNVVSVMQISKKFLVLF